MTPEVTIVIVSYNSGPLTRRCLDSAVKDLAGVTWEAVLVDNASPDGSGWSLPEGPGITVVRNPVNAGFGTAVNQAVRTSDAPLVWLLNPDCDVEPGAFATLSGVLRRNDMCAIAAPQLLNADGSVQASARGEPSMSTGLFGRHSLLARLLPRAGASRRNLPAADLVREGAESTPVDWVMGAAMLIRRDRFEAVGGFDERYFLYWEDADLCRRLRDIGFTIRYVPGARVRHPGGASAGTASRLAIREFHRSAYRYYATHAARSPWHPGRWIARVALGLRAWWRIARRR
jgi:GT2 family glycosyltransferase